MLFDLFQERQEFTEYLGIAHARALRGHYAEKIREANRLRMIDNAVRSATHDLERRVIMADVERLGGALPSFHSHVACRIRAEFHRIAAEQAHA